MGFSSDAHPNPSKRTWANLFARRDTRRIMRPDEPSALVRLIVFHFKDREETYYTYAERRAQRSVRLRDFALNSRHTIRLDGLYVSYRTGPFTVVVE